MRAGQCKRAGECKHARVPTCFCSCRHSAISAFGGSGLRRWRSLRTARSRTLVSTARIRLPTADSWLRSRDNTAVEIRRSVFSSSMVRKEAGAAPASPAPAPACAPAPAATTEAEAAAAAAGGGSWSAAPSAELTAAIPKLCARAAASASRCRSGHDTAGGAGARTARRHSAPSLCSRQPSRLATCSSVAARNQFSRACAFSAASRGGGSAGAVAPHAVAADPADPADAAGPAVGAAVAAAAAAASAPAPAFGFACASAAPPPRPLRFRAAVASAALLSAASRSALSHAASRAACPRRSRTRQQLLSCSSVCTRAGVSSG
jgi:hypothetical protein